MPRPLTKRQVEALLTDLETLIHRFNAGELDASISMRHRIEGAATALNAVLGEIELSASDIAKNPLHSAQGVYFSINFSS
jgi:hypothetical protein